MAKLPLKLTGIALNSAHVDDFLEKQPPVAWIELEPEPYFVEGGKALQQLDDLAKACPIGLHSSSLSLASTDDLNWHTFRMLRELSLRIHACLISDHLAWSSVNGHYLHQHLPFPYTEDTLAHLISRVKQIQDTLGHSILIENCAQLVSFQQTTLSEATFLNRLAEETGCGILLDLTSVYVSANNLDFNPSHYLNTLTGSHIQAIHLSGFSTTVINETPLLLATKNQPIVPAIWTLFEETIKKVGTKPTLIEWESSLPPLETILEEAYRAETIMRETYVATKLAG